MIVYLGAPVTHDIRVFFLLPCSQSMLAWIVHLKLNVPYQFFLLSDENVLEYLLSQCQTVDDLKKASKPFLGARYV